MGNYARNMGAPNLGGMPHRAMPGMGATAPQMGTRQSMMANLLQSTPQGAFSGAPMPGMGEMPQMGGMPAPGAPMPGMGSMPGWGNMTQAPMPGMGGTFAPGAPMPGMGAMQPMTQAPPAARLPNGPRMPLA